MTGVTVVVPVRDGGALLAPALASVLAQDGVEVDLLVVDDGSQDGSGDVAARCGARVVRTGGAGAGAARNLGAARARHALICFHDADDEMLPGKLAAQVALLGTTPGAGAVLVDQEVVLSDGIPHPAWFVGGRAPTAYAGSALFDVEALLLAGGYDTAVPHHEDVDLLRRLRDVGRPPVRLEQPLLRRHVHGGNGTSHLAAEAGWFAAARAATLQRRQPVPPVTVLSGGPVERNLGALESRSPLLQVRPGLVLTREVVARVGLWPDVADDESWGPWTTRLTAVQGSSRTG